MGAARSIPAWTVPQREPKPLVSRAPLTGSTALGRAASAAAATAALSASSLDLRCGSLFGVAGVPAHGELTQPIGRVDRR